MSNLLTREPFGKRDDNELLAEMIELVQHHVTGSPEYAAIVGEKKIYSSIAELPFLHVGLFKYLSLRTNHESIKHGRILHSSSTSGVSSKIMLDERSSSLQSESSRKILANFIGKDLRPLLLIDSKLSLLKRGTLSARLAASMSLKPFSSEIYFLLEQIDEPASMQWDLLLEILDQFDSLLVYGFSWILWLAWAKQEFPEKVKRALKGKKITFIHSGGWKKLEDLKIGHEQFNAQLLHGLDPASSVVDYYGLVEQVGVVYPMCSAGYRHPPVWADVIVRDSYTLEPVVNQVGQLQLLNILSWGAPYHSVYTEDMAMIVPGDCPCGRSGNRFKLLGRLPKSEVRGCANV